MFGFTLTLPEAIILGGVCAGYATFLWVQFRAGRFAVLWSCVGVVCIQAASSLSAANMPTSLAAAGFHAALVGTMYTASRKNPKSLGPEAAPSKD